MGHSVEAVEEANDNQLHEILEAIMNTTYFRMIKVVTNVSLLHSTVSLDTVLRVV